MSERVDSRGSTYDGEFIESFVELVCEINVLRSDVRVDQVEELRRFTDNVERFQVVWLLS